jgi:hypothetical protein
VIRRIALLAAILTICGGGVAHADPPGPTDYQSRVVAITPAVAGVSARIIGGDSFFELSVDTSVTIEVVVVGYRGEPYLRFRPGGEVQENERSPSKYLNRSRYETSSPPPEADPAADPEWKAVAQDGRWAWHDHRTHWMNTARPLGHVPGDQILEAVIPLLVDGAPVSVTVTSTWMPAPSSAPMLLGALGGGGLGAAAIAAAWLAAHRRTGGRRRRSDPGRLASIVLAGGAAAALAVGAWQTWSVPAQTGPPITAWALPATALVVAAVGAVHRWSRFTSAALSIVASAQLILWVVLRRDVLVRAILPTDAPFWFDRGVTAGAGVLALALGVAAVSRLARMLVGGPPPTVVAGLRTSLTDHTRP